MALTYNSTQGNLIVPGAYSSYTVQTSNSGLATTGVVLLMGEADAGPDYTKETDLSLNFFGPDQLSDVQAKYKSGNLVDAFRACANPDNDPNITGAPSQIILVKTNTSTKATGSLLTYAGGTYATIADKSYGQKGNLIYFDVLAKQLEVVPTTGSFTWIPNAGTVNADLRVNGGSAQALGLSANTSPAALQTAIAALTGVTATGGAARTVLPNAGSLTLNGVSGNSLVINYTSTWTTTPSVGDTLIIPIGSAIVGAASANVGAYVVTAASSNTISVTKLSDAGASSPVPGTITAPAAVTSTAVTASTNFTVYAPVVVSLTAANPTAGVGKSLEISELTTGTDLLSRCTYNLSSTPVTWVSKAASPQLLVSAAEYICTLDANRQFDALSESNSYGGEIALSLSYAGTTASVTVTATTISSAVTGGTGAAFPTLNLADYPTIADLATYINTLTGWKASVGSNVLGSLPSTALDQATFTCASTQGALNGRIKVDAYKFFTGVSSTSVMVQIGSTTVARAAAGIPGPTPSTFMTGGAKGGTTDLAISNALVAAEKVRCNFVVPLFSRDASADIVDGLTDSTSTYTIAAVHANVKSHVIAMSKLKAQRFRQGFLSYRGTFAAAKNVASGVASALCDMSFQDQKVLAADGTIKQFHPWMDSVLAAGMQAAGFYRSIMRKFKNISGSLQAAGDFNDQSNIDLETALSAGLLVTKRHVNGGYYFVSDQTTYGADNNFVWNSTQCVYAANIIALTAKQRMEDAFVGQSVADVSAPIAKTYFEGIMADFRRLKLIAPSDDAKAGFKDLRVVINGNALIVSVNIKLANAIAFIPINFSISQVTQTA